MMRIKKRRRGKEERGACLVGALQLLARDDLVDLRKDLVESVLDIGAVQRRCLDKSQRLLLGK